jgi:DNA ligase-1
MARQKTLSGGFASPKTNGNKPSRDATADANGKEEEDSGSSKKRGRIVISDSDDEGHSVEDKELAAGPSKVARKAENGKVDIGSDTDVETDEEDDEEYEEQAAAAKEEDLEKKRDGQAVKKLAAIFEKRAPTEDQASWKQGQPVPFSALAKAFVQIEATTKRLEKLEVTTKLLVKIIQLTPEDLLPAVYLCINRLCPDYEGLELGIGEGILIKSIAQSTGRDVARIKKDLEAKGDLGLVAIGSRQKQPTMFKSAALSIRGVFKQLKEIAALSGNKSQERKIGGIKRLLASSNDEEPKFIIRSLEGKLRIGLAEKTVLVALAQSVVLADRKGKQLKGESLAQDLEKAVEVVKAVFSELPSYDIVVPTLLKVGVTGLREECKLTPGVPLKPMLAKPTKAIGEVLDRFEGKPFTCEYKYDGERAQVHFFKDAKGKSVINVFSRNSENMSVKYPDIVEQLPRCIKEGVQSFVLDAECTAWQKADEGKGLEARLLPFQELSRRKRKDIKVEDIKVKVKLFGFDLLYLNGKPLLNMDLSTRRKLLTQSFVPVQDEFDFAISKDCTASEEIQAFLDLSVKEGCEGLMVKMLEGNDATYEPSRRSMNWLKLKKDYLAGTGDSLDLVVIGAYFGKGKRTNVYGAFLLACYDADSESYQAVCKIGTGFSEEALETHHKTLSALEIATRKGYYDVGDAKPDVYFEAKVVWEVLAADLSLSPVYSAAKGLVDSRGISLRFPRYIRIRDDKDPEDSTGPDQVRSQLK